jgi:uncharacterized YigZ family protein
MSAARATLAAAARFELEVRRSRFVAHAAPVDGVDRAVAFIESQSDRSATHNCWAWRVGQQYRFNDDGEPSGPAGKPILQAMDGQELDGVVVLVTRWFGGIKLGAGGLMRAYGGCAAECLRAAPRRVLVDLAEVECAVAFGVLPILQARLADFEAASLGETFVADGAVVRLQLPADNVEMLRRSLADLSRGRALLRVVG